MLTSSNVDSASASTDSDEEITPLRCWDCNVNFTNKNYLYAHLFHHIKQPCVVLERTQLPSLKITLKNKSGNNFEIVSSPTTSSSSPLGSPSHVPAKSQSCPLDSSSQNPSESTSNLAEIKEEAGEETTQPEQRTSVEEERREEERLSFSPRFASVEELGSNQGSPVHSDSGNGSSVDKPSLDSLSTLTTDSILNTNSNSESNASEYGSIPGAEPTPPPEPTVGDYPKIRIKTTGLLKESLTITEITDDNPDGDPSFRSLFLDQNDSSNLWSSSSLEDPLKLPDNDDNNILSLFNNNERAKDLGFHSSDNEFISLDRLEERNRGAMQLYNSSSQNPNSLDSLTGLPMQALAQQVSRLQPSGNGMHQQNVLINIQQFPSGPPQPSYQPPPMYPYPPQPPMHQPYQYHSSYRPPNPMYYPPGPPVYPPQHMPPPPQPQLTQLGQAPMNQQQMGHPSINQPPMNQNQMPPTSQPQNVNQQMQQQQQQSTPYRQPMPPRQMPPRQAVPGNRMPNGSRPPMGQRQPMTRQRAPMMRPRGGPGMTAVRTVRPRMPNAPNGVRQQQSPVKRTPEQTQQIQAKKKRFDMLTPDKDDDDCQVICMQPKNTDGGLPQIESVQGGTSEPAESSIMHLSDSITLSVRNPPPKPASPKKSDAKAVANILATRGITVTATAKPKEKCESPQKTTPSLPSSLNLNGAVSIIPAAKSNGTSKPASESLPTVDLTDDTGPVQQQSGSPQKQRPGLPYRCDLCPAQYPNAVGLNKHRQTYHKTASGMAELGIPLVNLKTPGILQKLTAMGICNYIPLPSSGPDGTFALPVINTRSPGNVANIGATTMLSLGPIRNIPKPQNSVNAAKQPNNQKS